VLLLLNECLLLFRYRLSPEIFGYTLVCYDMIQSHDHLIV